jgi:molybdopterin biosynthesis enzyme
MLSLSDARARIVARAEPGEAIEVTLAEALGLVLAEPAVADVDLPPFDRAALDGHAVRAADARAGERLRIVEASACDLRTAELAVDGDEAACVKSGDPMPLGTDAVLRTEESRPEPGSGPPRLIEVLRGVGPGQNVTRRGFYLRAGTELAPAGTRLRLAMVGLLAAQGCVHPVCYRRVRVAVVAVGDNLVGPADAPVMHRERNATGPTVVAHCLRFGATAHDLGAVGENEFDAALARALTAPVVVVTGPVEGLVPRALRRAGVEPVVTGVSLHPGDRLQYGVVRAASGRVEHHVFLLPPSPAAALTLATLLIGPLIDRLQGGATGKDAPLRATLAEPHGATDDRDWAVPATLTLDEQARLVVSPIPYRGKDDLASFARADALLLLPARSGPWDRGDVVDAVPIESGLHSLY